MFLINEKQGTSVGQIERERERESESAKLEMERNRIFSSKEKINSFDSNQENIFSQCLKIVFV